NLDVCSSTNEQRVDEEKKFTKAKQMDVEQHQNASAL
ncbi:hypothetical protein J2Z52_002563, partial [Enterococcus rivorum]|nr:hypothetical protein [Enterococcus rivorum]